MDLLDNIKGLGDDLPAYFCILLSMMVIGVLHFKRIIIAIFVVLFFALLMFPEKIWILGSIAAIYAGALRFFSKRQLLNEWKNYYDIMLHICSLKSLIIEKIYIK